MRHFRTSIALGMLSTSIALIVSAGARGEVPARLSWAGSISGMRPRGGKAPSACPTIRTRSWWARKDRSCWILVEAVSGTSASCFNRRSTRATWVKQQTVSPRTQSFRPFASRGRCRAA